MPQRKVEKKFFQRRVSRRLQNIESLIAQSLILVKLQGFQINITGGAK
ncbi:hypothetical protein H1P_6770002 [Hyella patelloides LEGE 07179]|uniref:Uncharacterized protein n=1 Tax=Hyella patelloides LEGE 07179 TaxID=945734 RepID=A0A563W2Y3_9CYAN|nr:hypothetical protein H1P_6770002 [Hyella patelloides LEGE 07179]